MVFSNVTLCRKHLSSYVVIYSCSHVLFILLLPSVVFFIFLPPEGTVCLCTEQRQSINTEDVLKTTALHWEAPHGHRELAELLLGCGANVLSHSELDMMDPRNTELNVLLQVDGWE